MTGHGLTLRGGVIVCSCLRQFGVDKAAAARHVGVAPAADRKWVVQRRESLAKQERAALALYELERNRVAYERGKLNRLAMLPRTFTASDAAKSWHISAACAKQWLRRREREGLVSEVEGHAGTWTRGGMGRDD